MAASFTVMLEGKQRFIPYRSHRTLYHFFAHSQEDLCACTRNYSGFVRERSLVRLLKCRDIRYASLPYILKLAEEYVIEITEIVANSLPLIPDAMWREFLRENPRWLDIMEHRCISYWDCYFRRGIFPDNLLLAKGGYHLHPEMGRVYFNRNDYPGIQAVNYLRRVCK